MTAGSSVLIERRHGRFDLGRDRWRGAAAEMSFDLEAVKHGRIVASRDDDAANETTAEHFEGNVRGRIGPIHQHRAKSVAGEDFCRTVRELFREEANVVADEHRMLVTLNRLNNLRWPGPHSRRSQT